jgi:hypothetical protein
MEFPGNYDRVRLTTRNHLAYNSPNIFTDVYRPPTGRASRGVT